MAISRRSSTFALARFLKKNLLMVLTFVSVVLGFAIGFGLREVKLNDMAKMWLDLPGHCFLSMLRVTIVPLIASSVISSVSTMNPKENGKLGGMHLAYLLLTNVLGATVGVVLGVIIQRTGNKLEDQSEVVVESRLQTVDVFADLIRNLFPDNIVRLTIQKIQTDYTVSHTPARWAADNTTVIENATINQTRFTTYVDSLNLLGLMAVSVVFGIAASSAGEKGKAFIAFFSSATDIIIVMLQWFVWLAPLGVFFLMTRAIVDIGDLEATFSKVGFFVLAVVSGLLLYQLVLIPLIYLIVARKNAFKIYPYSIEPWLVGFASGSSACALPFMYEMIEIPEVGWNHEAAHFALPTAIAINADGSALFIANAVFFMAQLTGTPMDVGNIFLAWVLTCVTSLALPAVPSASLVSVVIVCAAAGIPTTYIGLLFTVEWLLDRLRTACNVLGEIISVSFISHFYLKAIKKQSNSEDEPEENEEFLNGKKSDAGSLV